MRISRLLKIGAIIIILSQTSCTHFFNKKQDVQYKISERERENNSAALISGNLTKENIIESRAFLMSTNLEASKLKLEDSQRSLDVNLWFLRRNENLIGKPNQDQTRIVTNLLSTNSIVQKAEIARQESKESQEEKWNVKIDELNRKLEAYGQQFEAERNSNIFKRVFRWLFSTLGIAGIILLCVFCPAAIPIVLRIFTWIISKFPPLLHVAGVVGADAMKAVVRGVGEVRNDFIKNPTETITKKEALSMLDTSLKFETDRSHRNIIDELRRKTNVP